jgi:hypothetical protein
MFFDEHYAVSLYGFVETVVTDNGLVFVHVKDRTIASYHDHVDATIKVFCR